MAEFKTKLDLAKQFDLMLVEASRAVASADKAGYNTALPVGTYEVTVSEVKLFDIAAVKDAYTKAKTEAELKAVMRDFGDKVVFTTVLNSVEIQQEILIPMDPNRISIRSMWLTEFSKVCEMYATHSAEEVYKALVGKTFPMYRNYTVSGSVDEPHTFVCWSTKLGNITKEAAMEAFIAKNDGIAVDNKKMEDVL